MMTKNFLIVALVLVGMMENAYANEACNRAMAIGAASGSMGVCPMVPQQHQAIQPQPMGPQMGPQQGRPVAPTATTGMRQPRRIHVVYVGKGGGCGHRVRRGCARRCAPRRRHC